MYRRGVSLWGRFHPPGKQAALTLQASAAGCSSRFERASGTPRRAPGDLLLHMVDEAG